jgi:hypothetical protein
MHKKRWAGGVVRMVECFLSKLKALSSNANTVKKGERESIPELG